MIFEQSNDKCRLNFRSKGKYVINEVAKAFGGGGHKFPLELWRMVIQHMYLIRF